MAALFFTSCGKVVFDETHAIKNNNWMRFEPETFMVDIRNADDYYNVDMTVTIDTNMVKGKDFPLVINIISEDDELRMFDSHIPLVDYKTGKRLGTFEGSVQTATFCVRKFMSFNKSGKYKVEVKQGTPKYELPGVYQFGVRVEKAKLELPE